MRVSPRFGAPIGVLAASVVLLSSMAILWIVPRRSRPIAAADVGTQAPDFRLQDTDGRTVGLSSYRGEVVVLCFGSLHSPDAAKYDQRVDRLAREYAADSRVQFLALDVPESGPVDPVRVRVDANLVGRPFPTLIDEHAAVATRYSAKELPTFIVIDRNGTVAYRGGFDDNTDAAFATRHYLAEALHEVTGAPARAMAQALR